MPTFGEEINRLALAVTIVNEDGWKDICRDLDTYFSQKVGASFWEICVAGIRIDNVPGLKTVVSSNKEEHNYRIVHDEEAAFPSFRAYAFVKNKFLWIVDKKKRPLNHESAEIEDRWSKAEEDKTAFPAKLPDGYPRSPKTAFFSPLNFQNNTFGVFTMEHEQQKPLTKEVQKEVNLVVDALARIVRMWQTTQEQVDALSGARDRFKEFVKECPSIADKSKIFVASPKNRDVKVWEAILGVLGKPKYDERFEVVPWDEKSKPGDIVTQIFQDASDATLGICLFSEHLPRASAASKSKPEKAADNSNVVFEAGVFQALVKSSEHPCRALICIREQDDLVGRPFFDIEHERLCIIDRKEKTRGFVDEDFRRKLEKMIDDALGE